MRNGKRKNLGDEMMSTYGIGRFHSYDSKGLFGIPARLWRDSSFPFSNGDEVAISINGDESITIRKHDSKQRVLDDVR